MSKYRKYRNVKTVVDGITFASKKESGRYAELKLLAAGHAIMYLELQPKIKIVIGGVVVKYDSGRQVSYVGDFRYFDVDKQVWIVEDTKGYATRNYKLKKAMVRAMGVEVVET